MLFSLVPCDFHEQFIRAFRLPSPADGIGPREREASEKTSVDVSVAVCRRLPGNVPGNGIDRGVEILTGRSISNVSPL